MAQENPEAKTRRELITPALIKASWDKTPHSYTEEETITDGRIIPLGQKAKRQDGLRADYVLRYNRDFKIAVKEELLKAFNLHTIVRLPNGVFAPYTSIPTNLLFFDRTGPTKEIWYYEIPLPEGRKNYTKTKPMRFEEFSACLDWWDEREENDNAWCVPVADVLKYDDNDDLLSVNLDLKNPNAAEAIEHLPPEELVADIIKKERQILALMDEIGQILNQ